MANLLDSFIESMENVPPELERNFTLITDLDRRTQEVMDRINECVSDYELATELSQRAAIKRQSDELFEKLRSYSDDKVELADRTYDLIDKNIKRLLSLKDSMSKVASLDEQPVGLEMPIDPNEPKYCFCHNISHGEMVACDNHECPIEWFHLTCVGLQVAPKTNETWYCYQCAPIHGAKNGLPSQKGTQSKASARRRNRIRIGGTKKSKSRTRKR